MVMQQLEELPKKRLHIVLGMVNDKNLSDILKLLPQKALYYFCKADIPRGLPAETLLQEAAAFHLHGAAYASVAKAYQSAVKQAREEDVVFVGGSTFTVAEVL
jgi:dihydrofolate synthase/folylpolyglutamate synthase